MKGLPVHRQEMTADIEKSDRSSAEGADVGLPATMAGSLFSHLSFLATDHAEQFGRLRVHQRFVAVSLDI